MRFAILIPTYFAENDEGRQRAAVWSYVKELWRNTLPGDVYEGHDPLVDTLRDERSDRAVMGRQFSTARAFNDAARQALDTPGYDAFLLFGADHVPPSQEVFDWARHQLESGWSWLRLYERIAYASEATTAALLHDEVRPGGIAWQAHRAPCPGVVAVTVQAWQAASVRVIVRNGDGLGWPWAAMDPAYEGHGYEDNQLNEDLTAVAGHPGPPSSHVLRELWHPAERDYSLSNHNRRLFERLNQS